MVHLPATDQVLVIGGAIELPLQPDEPFPLAWPKGAGLSDCALFDPPSPQHPEGRCKTIFSDRRSH